VYAIVKAGGRQEKVSVGETLVVDRLDAAIGSSVTFPAVLLVDGADVTTDPKALAAVKVTGEILAEQKGPKIAILRYKKRVSPPHVMVATQILSTLALKDLLAR